jgi:hypothetical protein
MEIERYFRMALAAAVFLAAGPALAADNSTSICLNAGNQYKVGEYACIAACHGERRLARCDAVADQASWTFVSNACPSALLPPSPSDATALPLAVAMTPIPLPIEHLMSEMAPEAWMRLTEAGRGLAVNQ